MPVLLAPMLVLGLGIAGPARTGDAVERLEDWLADVRWGRADFGEAALADLTGRLAELAGSPGLPPELPAEREAEGWSALLDVIVLPLDPPRAMPPDFGERAALLARGAFEDVLRSEERGARLLDWLHDRALVASRDAVPARRRAAVSVLAGRGDPATRLALLTLARGSDEELRWAAFDALAGRRDEAVHDLYLDALEELPPPETSGEPRELARASRLWAVVERHLAELGAPLEGSAADRLARAVVPRTMAPGWRTAARAIRLLPALPARSAVPAAIEALATWRRRHAEGGGSLRIEHALSDELKRRSGRNLGLEPESWARWWEGVRSGRIELAAGDGDEGGEARRLPTIATFFGLRPRSDRVIFVIDRSASMDRLASYRTGRSRFDEAGKQLGKYLEAVGERARFGVVLFSDDARRWRSRLADASPSAVRAARRFLERNGPDGGTRLSEGLDEAFDLRPGRTLDPERVEADTVVVLCDGATVEDGRWAREWLERHNSEAEIVFHCVQIGSASNGALEALAAGTGGSFLRADGG